MNALSSISRLDNVFSDPYHVVDEKVAILFTKTDKLILASRWN